MIIHIKRDEILILNQLTDLNNVLSFADEIHYIKSDGSQHKVETIEELVAMAERDTAEVSQKLAIILKNLSSDQEEE